jgi:hypothetical protein
MFLDFSSTIFIGYYVPIMISNWMWSDSNSPALVVLFLIPPLYAILVIRTLSLVLIDHRYCHGAIFIRTSLQFLEISREQSRGPVSLA